MLNDDRPQWRMLRADGDGTTRRTEVLAYDYRGDKLVKVAVDLTVGRVTGTFAATGRQQPRERASTAAPDRSATRGRARRSAG
ncbi:hypothetical protein [Micromonospora foliorum]|uniref:hypothetical protein n=1 Tax=Micromonospora foliorum TaxID=2911210 RepID=UPI001EE91337|nr:hypothetical protein [Micromonospora foliorum]MCG5434747.1 hypothetical protein [Micromonospora foliorum]